MTRMVIVALSVIALSAAALPAALHAQAASAKAMTVGGTVKAVTTESITIVSGAKDMMFKVDSTTKFVAKGLGTKAAKGKIMATDAVAVGDMVRVTYHDLGGGAMHAATVRVTAKAMPAKK
jgi:predicted ATP-dependent Lon-type protease